MRYSFVFVLPTDRKFMPFTVQIRPSIPATERAISIFTTQKYFIVFYCHNFKALHRHETHQITYWHQGNDESFRKTVRNSISRAARLSWPDYLLLSKYCSQVLCFRFSFSLCVFLCFYAFMLITILTLFIILHKQLYKSGKQP